MPLVMGSPWVGGYFGSASVGIDATGNLGDAVGKKWNPGHYMQLLRNNTFTLTQSARFSVYDDIASETALEGVAWMPRWGQLEGSQGDYSSGFSLIHSELDYLAALTVPKRLILRIEHVHFGGTCPSSRFPQYVIDNSWLFQTNNGCVWRRWNSSAMDAYIDMIEAYAAEFDDEPYFEAIHITKETAGNWGGTSRPAGASDSNHDVEYRRLITAAGSAFVKTNVIFPINFHGSNSLCESLFTHMASNKVGQGNPDTCPTCAMQGDEVLIGNTGGTDHRGAIPIIYSIETSELGLNSVGRTGGYTPTELYDYLDNTLHATHALWDRNTFAGTSEQQWSTGILPFIQANPTFTNDSLPSVYT